MPACCQCYSPSSWLPYPNYVPFALHRALLEEPSLVGFFDTYLEPTSAVNPHALVGLSSYATPPASYSLPIVSIFYPWLFCTAFNFQGLGTTLGFFPLHLPHPFICNTFIIFLPGILCCLGDIIIYNGYFYGEILQHIIVW